MAAMDVIYLDNNATTKPAPQVVEAMTPYLGELYGNPSSVHRLGQRSRQAIDEARSQIAQLVGCTEGELMFTGGGTEAINTAVRGILNARLPRNRIITSTVEHSATRELCQQLAREGAQVVEIEVDRDGLLNLDQLKKELDERATDVALVTMMWANNETGVLQPASAAVPAMRSKAISRFMMHLLGGGTSQRCIVTGDRAQRKLRVLCDNKT
jgi:cysteine desulfurase